MENVSLAQKRWTVFDEILDKNGKDGVLQACVKEAEGGFVDFAVLEALMTFIYDDSKDEEELATRITEFLSVDVFSCAISTLSRRISKAVTHNSPYMGKLSEVPLLWKGPLSELDGIEDFLKEDVLLRLLLEKCPIWELKEARYYVTAEMSLRGFISYHKESMYDPESFEHVWTGFEDFNNLFWMVTMVYRGKNGFGGLTFGKVRAKIDMERNLLDCWDVDMDE